MRLLKDQPLLRDALEAAKQRRESEMEVARGLMREQSQHAARHSTSSLVRRSVAHGLGSITNAFRARTQSSELDGRRSSALELNEPQRRAAEDSSGVDMGRVGDVEAEETTAVPLGSLRAPPIAPPWHDADVDD